MTLTVKKFFVNKDNDYEEMASRVGAHRIFLENILAGKVPNEEYSPEKLALYCASFIERQRKGVSGLADGSWSVSPDPSGVSEEDRMDYHYFPTFIALAILTICAEKFPEEIGALPGLEEALAGGYRFALTGNLEGYGFNSLFQQIESVLILGSGGCLKWLAARPEVCPGLNARLAEIAREYRTRLEGGDTALPFGGDYKVQFTLALKFLQPFAG